MAENTDNIKQIDFAKIAQEVKKNKKKYYIGLPIAFLLSSLIILCVPRYYTCTVKLAPELSSLGANSLTDLASSFGFDLSGGSTGTNDAILPELYPELMQSTDFRTSLFSIKIKTQDGSVNTTYYDYLDKHQKHAWWTLAFAPIHKLFDNDSRTPNVGKHKLDPFQLTKKETDITEVIDRNVTCDVDKKNYVISITVQDQDPLVCAVMADSATARLQQFITEYRTKKAKVDLLYAQNLAKEAKARYERSRQRYAAFSDNNTDIVLPSYKLRMEDMENDMQLQYNAYSAVVTQLNAAYAKLQENTPAFTILQNATVPLKPSHPKRMIFVLFMTFLTFMGITVYSIRDMLKM